MIPVRLILREVLSTAQNFFAILCIYIDAKDVDSRVGGRKKRPRTDPTVKDIVLVGYDSVVRDNTIPEAFEKVKNTAIDNLAQNNSLTKFKVRNLIRNEKRKSKYKGSGNPGSQGD